MIVIKISTEEIKLDQFLKFINAVGSGGEAKIVIKEGLVKVNNEQEVRRGKKIKAGDIIEFGDIKYKIEKNI